MADDREVEFDLGKKTLRARGYDLSHLSVVVFMVGALSILYYWGGKMASSLASIAESQREFACVISQPQDERPKEIYDPNSFCKRLARYGYS